MRTNEPTTAPLRRVLDSARGEPPTPTWHADNARLRLRPDPGTPKERLAIPRMRSRIPEALAATLRDCTDGREPWPLFAYGPAGVGKTCAALYLADRVIGSVVFRDFQGLCDEAADAKLGRLMWYGTHSSTIATPEMLWTRFGAYTLAVIDEIGTRNTVTDHAYETLKHAIDARFRLPLVLVSNLDLDELARLFDDRVASRIAAGTQVCVNGPDQRLQREARP
jgi:DNA replication protein DnaC